VAVAAQVVIRQTVEFGEVKAMGLPTEPQFRMINQSLGQQPSLGLIPIGLLAPSGSVRFVSYFLVRVLLNLSFPIFLAISIWAIALRLQPLASLLSIGSFTYNTSSV
jgi:hypothetical protein